MNEIRCILEATLKLGHAMTFAVTLTALALATLTSPTSGRKSASATATTNLCSYTVVVDEFDVSKCPAVTEHAQADGLGPGHMTSDVTTPMFRGREEAFYRRQRGGKKSKNNAGHHKADVSGEATMQLKEVESKLIDEMVKSRELNLTLTKHEQMLNDAQQTLTAYRANFSSVFRTMMQMERKLKAQRRVNRSHSKKLANLILDVVEINNVMTSQLPTGDAAKDKKSFKVESTSAMRSCPGVTEKTTMYKDCSEVYQAGHHASDIYFIKPIYTGCPIPVWCDMETPGGGWLLFQRRRDGSVSFDGDWAQYRHGFGDISGEHWLGLDNLFLLTNQARYQLRVDLWDFSGNRVHATYSTFRIDGERDQYRLDVSGYSGSAKDSLHKHQGQKFSTKDRDNDGRREASCAREWEAGWWFDNCWNALLNGPYQNRSDASWRGMAWNHWKREQLRATEMKIRPI